MDLAGVFLELDLERTAEVGLIDEVRNQPVSIVGRNGAGVRDPLSDLDLLGSETVFLGKVPPQVLDRVSRIPFQMDRGSVRQDDLEPILVVSQKGPHFPLDDECAAGYLALDLAGATRPMDRRWRGAAMRHRG